MRQFFAATSYKSSDINPFKVLQQLAKERVVITGLPDVGDLPPLPAPLATAPLPQHALENPLPTVLRLFLPSGGCFAQRDCAQMPSGLEAVC